MSFPIHSTSSPVLKRYSHINFKNNLFSCKNKPTFIDLLLQGNSHYFAISNSIHFKLFHTSLIISRIPPRPYLCKLWLLGIFFKYETINVYVLSIVQNPIIFATPFLCYLLTIYHPSMDRYALPFILPCLLFRYCFFCTVCPCVVSSMVYSRLFDNKRFTIFGCLFLPFSTYFIRRYVVETMDIDESKEMSAVKSSCCCCSLVQDLNEMEVRKIGVFEFEEEPEYGSSDFV